MGLLAPGDGPRDVHRNERHRVLHNVHHVRTDIADGTDDGEGISNDLLAVVDDALDARTNSVQDFSPYSMPWVFAQVFHACHPWRS